MKVEVLKYDSMHVAESGTTENEVVISSHGALDGDFFFNYTQCERPTNRLTGDTARRRIYSASTDSFQVTSSISGQTMGDIVMLYKYQEIAILDKSMVVSIAAQQESSVANFRAQSSYTAPGSAIFTDGMPVSGTASQTYAFTIETAVFAAKTAQGDDKTFHNSEGESGEIHTFYGISGTVSTDALNTYNISGDSWAAGSSAAAAKNKAQSCLIDGKIYESGGDGSKTTNEYNISGDAWTTKTDATAIRDNGDGVGFDGIFFNTQGEDGGGLEIITDTYYLPVNDTWYSFGANVLFTRKGSRFHWATDFKAYAAGGQNFYGYYAASNIELIFTANAYYGKTAIPDEAANPSAISMEQYGGVVGGFDSTDTFDALYVWSEPRDTWVNVATHPDPGKYGRGSVA